MVTYSPLPPLFDRWMQECLPGPIPSESKATCQDCAMCASGSPASRQDAVFYDPQTKCCTYMPMLWNFLVGRVLDDETPEAHIGRQSVEARIDRGIAVTPLGLERPPAYQALYSHIPEAFGRAQSMRCPHYIEQGGLCGVWRARESTCATWFCKHERGALGKSFWHEMHRLLRLAEEGVARWCLLELDLEPEALRLQSPGGAGYGARPKTGPDFDGRPDRDRQRRVWGRWAGREREFYRRAAKLADVLSWKNVREMAGAELEMQARVVGKLYGDLTSLALPKTVRTATLQFAPLSRDACLVTTYSVLDPLRLPRELVEVLPYFDAYPTAEALLAIEEEERLSLEPELVRKLVDFAVLKAEA